MKVVGRKRLAAFCGKHADARKWIENWLAEIESASWATPNEVKRRYAAASLLGRNLIIFNVKGNDYRLEVSVAYRTSVVTVIWAGTHAEYDKRNTNR